MIVALRLPHCLIFPCDLVHLKAHLIKKKYYNYLEHEALSTLTFMLLTLLLCVVQSVYVGMKVVEGMLHFPAHRLFFIFFNSFFMVEADG